MDVKKEAMIKRKIFFLFIVRQKKTIKTFRDITLCHLLNSSDFSTNCSSFTWRVNEARKWLLVPHVSNDHGAFICLCLTLKTEVLQSFEMTGTV
jgi:hypothetical protein